MTRVARVLSDLGHYHVMVKGCADQLIFEDDDDRYYFLNLMSQRFTSDHIRLLAWCLMDNHVHLLFDDPDNRMSTAMHAIDTAYAMRFNLKTGRRGPVFQERFKSVVISDDEQLLRCVRYIHDNPAKAGISSAPMYRWSSFHEYFGTPEICDCSDIVELFGGSESFYLTSTDGKPNSYYLPEGKHVSDMDALEVAQALLAPLEPHQLKTLSKQERNRLLAMLKHRGFTIAQISRITGIGTNIIQRAK